MTTSVPGRRDLARAAAWYAAHGWAVFPVAVNGKRPVVEDWEHAATTDAHAIEHTWSRAPYNIGIACGPSDLLVIDLDQPKTDTEQPTPPWNQPGVRDGSDVLAVLAEDAGEPFPHGTHTVATGSGGVHLYFTQPEHGDRLRNTSGRLGWRIDTRGDGGYVIAAGSVVDGRRYRTLCTARPATLPVWIANSLATPAPPPATPDIDATTPAGGDAYAHAALRSELDQVLAAGEGTRNHTLNTAAYSLGQLVATGSLDRTTVEAALTVAAHHIGLDSTETNRTITSGLTAGAQYPRRTA